MDNGYILRTRFLQQAGLISALLGTVSFVALLLALRAQESMPKLFFGIFAVLGILFARAIGRDVLVRVKNAEADAELISLFQQKLALAGTRFTSVLSGLVILILLGSIVFFSVSYIDKTSMVCSGPGMKDFMRCAHDLFGWIFM